MLVLHVKSYAGESVRKGDAITTSLNLSMLALFLILGIFAGIVINELFLRKKDAGNE